MNRTLLSLLFCLFTTIASAQNGHLKFMGIPLDGTINEFSAKLAAKGCSVDEYLSQDHVGDRIFDGVFMGNRANLFVYYQPTTQIVYRAVAVIKKEDEDIIKSLYEEPKKLLNNKYIGFQKTDSVLGHETWSLFVPRVPSDEEMIWNRCYGNISLGITKLKESYHTAYALLINYTDQINYDKYQNAKQDDL